MISGSLINFQKRIKKCLNDFDPFGTKYLAKLLSDAKEANEKFKLEMFKYEFLDLHTSKVFIDYIEKKARELADKENIKIFFVPFDEMNKDETDESNKAVGLFRYINKNNVEYIAKCSDVIKYHQKIYGDIAHKFLFPRIEISEKADVFVILHELGHYFLYKRDITQSELAADQFVEEFFDNYLPPFLKWIYQMEISIRSKKDIKYTGEESKQHYENYLKFKEEYGE